ncbi:hypothetical protein FB45DRAFT_1059353 [Roridomyces roridus]|uniref:Uncharacterized protein n=1 Tax=Roridomyces roridus TaxID=1738132 RepID=A0AAD7FK12_9AGAR|nr:hypothetical protein FB45DRAFT_1059353 [Roridomyces roridus]
MSGKTSIFRVISFSLAGGDLLQTIPGTYALYKKQWVNRTLSPVCFFYACARYLTLISLISNGIGFYSQSFTLETCKPFYMLPNITAMLAGMAIQILVFIRTYAISGRARKVYYGLGAILLIGFPIQIFGIVYHRDAKTTNVGDQHGFLGDALTLIGAVLNKSETDWNIVYYSAHLGYDLIACSVGTFYLVYSSRIQGVFNASKFVRRVLRNGLLYTLVVFLANLWVVLEFEQVLETGVGATLPLAIMLIAAQHLILSTQRPDSDQPSTTDEYSRSGPTSGNRTKPVSWAPRRSPFRTADSRHDVELQTNVFVVTETHMGSPNDELKTPEPTKSAADYSV